MEMVLAGLEKNRLTFPLYWWVGFTVLLLRQQLQTLQNETLTTLLHFKFYVHWTVHWTQYHTLSKQDRDRSSLTSVSLDTWTGLSEGYAHYWRMRWPLSPIPWKTKQILCTFSCCMRPPKWIGNKDDSQSPPGPECTWDFRQTSAGN